MREAIFKVYLFGITPPIELMVVPLFYQIKSLGLVNNLWGLVLAMVGTEGRSVFASCEASFGTCLTPWLNRPG